MNAPTVTREQAFMNARAVLDRALDRIASDRAAGRLSPEHELICRRLERKQRQQRPATTDRAAA
ncbi:hypothetical protein OOK39_21955 [Streptomyces sp. NBC_00264]|uniref:hypothetical protein n=1 Tax=unclassified Streptomyces TaxID=2593676 RepID=UPI0022567A96|nr:MULTISPECIES: hypothetical protein [unclassified Streptomyces]MCX5161910.1 hypothetical protein [Streptomyces sp. NBC_00305]MCX5220427.1 hypothetical protein [Streptomyces sp. NBC_00264]